MATSCSLGSYHQQRTTSSVAAAAGPSARRRVSAAALQPLQTTPAGAFGSQLHQPVFQHASVPSQAVNHPLSGRLQQNTQASSDCSMQEGKHLMQWHQTLLPEVCWAAPDQPPSQHGNECNPLVVPLVVNCTHLCWNMQATQAVNLQTTHCLATCNSTRIQDPRLHSKQHANQL